VDSRDPRAAIVEAIASSRRYRGVDGGVVRRIADEELRAAGGDVAEAVKRTKRHLHRVYGAYLPTPPRWSRLAAAIESAADPRAALVAAMRQHASTRERVDHLERLYGGIFAHTGAVARVLDLACGLGPLAAPWMTLLPDAEYFASDIDADLVDFCAVCLRRLGVRGHALVADLHDPPAWPAVDLVLVLKTLPCLQIDDPGATERVLAALPARWIAVSFPTRSLGGRDKGMRATYGARFEAWLSARGARAEVFEAGPELVYVFNP
jgi:16S rRNA (guanine(1405)-N(7))-methyltransferase